MPFVTGGFPIWAVGHSKRETGLYERPRRRRCVPPQAGPQRCPERKHERGRGPKAKLVDRWELPQSKRRQRLRAVWPVHKKNTKNSQVRPVGHVKKSPSGCACAAGWRWWCNCTASPTAGR
ncbi:hypothetical protein FKM82_008132 [Ascaphus truei]